MNSSHRSSTYTSWRSLAIIATMVSSTVAVGFDCGAFRDDGVQWNLKPLAGTHTVIWEEDQAPMVANWTFSIDLCHTIEKNKEIDDKEQCPQGTNVCGVQRLHSPGKPDGEITKVVPIAGAFTMKNGVHQEVKPTRLKNSDSHADAEREGVRLEMPGGRYPFDKKDGESQKAIVELICNREMTGWEPSEQPKAASYLDKRQEDSSKALKVISFKQESVKDVVFGVLRLEWRTKYACEDAASQPKDGSDSSGWGFFTWLIVIVFMAVAAYVIMGAWLNFTKYGARGLDLLPHSDTIRDIPYIVKDMLRRLQGSGSRGGYSAV